MALRDMQPKDVLRVAIIITIVSALLAYITTCTIKQVNQHAAQYEAQQSAQQGTKTIRNEPKSVEVICVRGYLFVITSYRGIAQVLERDGTWTGPVACP